MPPAESTPSPAVTFRATVETIDDVAVLRLPADASKALPSRGQVAVRATVNSARTPVRLVVEPDGRRGHWVRVADLGTKARVGDEVTCSLAVEPEWPEPTVPEDLDAALATAPGSVQQLWEDITPMARWEWVRWVQATRNEETRRRRVEVSISKLDHGKRRPCCFDLSACTDPDLARSGKLREPTG